MKDIGRDSWARRRQRVGGAVAFVVSAIAIACCAVAAVVVLPGAAPRARAFLPAVKTAPMVAATVRPESLPLRVGIAGLVHGHVDGFFAHYLKSPLVEIVGIAEPDEDLSKRVAKQYSFDAKLFYTSLDDMIEKAHPQAILIYSNTYDHRKLVEICAKHHVDVMMEKPLAVSYADARAIQRAANESGIQVMVNFETTWYASNRAAYDMLHRGDIGEMRKFVAHDGHQGPKEISVGPDFMKWLTDPKLDGAGALFDFGCYGADLVTWLMDGAEPVSVTAVTQQIKPDEYPSVDDEATIVVAYPHAQAIIQGSWNWPFGRKDIEVYGKTGYVKTVASDGLLIRREHDRDEHSEKANALPAPDDDELNYLRAVVLDHRKPEGPTSLRINIVAMEILDSARRSAETGQTVVLYKK
jgi:scyllo-inositol 2-dehydrogenase (NADP+)